MTLRIVGGNARDTMPRLHPNTAADMRELLVKSVKELSREVNFKSILDDCDSHARAAERPETASDAFWSEVVSTQDTISEIGCTISKIAAIDGTLTRLYSLCQSALSGVDCAEEIRRTLDSLGSEENSELDSKIVNLFTADDRKKSSPEWNAETLQLDKIDVSTPDAAEASLSLISSAISILAYGKARAEQLLSNKQQAIRKLSVARENRSAALSLIPPEEPYTGENHILANFKDRADKAACFSEARKVLLRRGYYE